jgi:hypothetical protein
MVSRTGTFSSFTANNDTSYNISRASNGGSTDTWDDNHILIHSIRIVNTHDTTKAVLYFYQDDNSTAANAISTTDLMFWLVVAASNQDRASNTLQVDFPIPLCIRRGCRVTSNLGGPIVNINYTVLNSKDLSVYDNDLKYRYLLGASLHSATANAIEDATKLDITADVEIWGGVVYNESTTADNYNSSYILSTGESDLKKATITQNEQKHADDDASAAFTGIYQPMWYPYPVICKGGAKIDCDDSDTYATWFYRERKSKSVDTIGWV